MSTWTRAVLGLGVVVVAGIIALRLRYLPPGGRFLAMHRRLYSVILFHSVQRRRDLAETLIWIEQTYNPHEGGDNIGQGHGSVGPFEGGDVRSDDISKMSFVRLGGCKFAINSQSVTKGGRVYPTSTSTLCLCDIDPVSIKITPYDVVGIPDGPVIHGEEIDFITTDGAPVITEEGMVADGKPSKTNKAHLIVDDVAYAQRLAKALKHAVELCGGKPSKFWPSHWRSKI